MIKSILSLKQVGSVYQRIVFFKFSNSFLPFQDGPKSLPIPRTLPLVRAVEDGDIQPAPDPDAQEGGRSKGHKTDHATDQQGKRQTDF